MRPVLLLPALLVVVACGTSDKDASESPRPPASTTQALARVEQVRAAVTAWQDSGTLAEAKAAAEEARNLVTGPDVTGYGDADGDGAVTGAATQGLLPGERGQQGLVQEPAERCVEQAVLGGSWVDPAGRWAEVRSRIAEWRPDNNTFPGLPSHPQRVVGWASLALAANTLEQAREYAGHAQFHVQISGDALRGC